MMDASYVLLGQSVLLAETTAIQTGEDDAARPFSGMTMGYWGAVTSDYDFCEKNYAITLCCRVFDL